MLLDLLFAAFVLNFLSIYLFKKTRDSLEGKRLKTAYDKNMEVLLRLNGFFIGAIGINMILTGIKNMFRIGL
jgi:multiple antibiotic resistance protein